MSSVYEYRATIKDTLMKKLYDKQLKKWNIALLHLATQNAVAHGREIEACTVYSIYFRNQQWTPEPFSGLDWDNWKVVPSCLPLHDSSIDFIERMERIADELNDIKVERYESERFLSGFVLFNGSPKAYEHTLGNTLFSAIAKEVNEHCGQYGNDICANKSLKTYAKNNVFIIEKMNERLLLNLITSN